MNAEPTMNHENVATAPTHRWADDGGVLTEERMPAPEAEAAPESEQSADSVGSVDPVDSVESAEPVDSESESVESVEPVESAEPVDSMDSVESADPETSMETTLEISSERLSEPAMPPSPSPAVPEPLLAADAEQTFRSRWTQIQIGFVQDPAESVRDADRLIEDISAAVISSIKERQTGLAAEWQQGSPGTEELRLALQRYRALIGVVLPR